MDQYRLESKKGDGAFSQVFKAKSIRQNRYVAIKCMKKRFQSLDRVRRLKEIQALKLLSHNQNIIKLNEVLYDQPTGKLALVFELMDQNMYECLRSRKLTHSKIKHYMWQLLKAIDFIHKKGIFHRDIKPQNILLMGDQVKLADFGSCKGMYIQQPYTQYISTRWYRAPQCLMTDGYYDCKMDIWGFGCVLFQVLSKNPLFPGKSQQDQVNRINNVLGTPKPQLVQRFKRCAVRIQTTLDFPFKRGCGIEKMCPELPSDALDLLYKLLTYDPLQRISAEDALKHEYFQQIYQRTNPIFVSTFGGMLRSRRQESQSSESGKQKKEVSYNKFPQRKPVQPRNTIEQQSNVQFPPIHSVGVGIEVRLNVYGHSTAKGDFKKPGITSILNKPKESGQQNYVLHGRKAI